MYFVRIVFYIEGSYDITAIENEKVMFEDGEKKCIFKMDRRYGKKKAIITYGGFIDYDEAKEKGENLLNEIRKQCVRSQIPINISGELGALDTNKESSCTARLTEYGKQNIEVLLPGIDTKGKIVEDEALGMRIHLVKEDISEYMFITQEIQISRQIETLNITNTKTIFNEKLSTAYSLLNASNLINDVIIGFILKVSALEALVSEKEYKKDSYCKLVKHFNKRISKDDTIQQLNLNKEDQANLDKIIQQIKCDVGSLKEKSISEKCCNLISKAVPEKRYGERYAIQFFKECYNVRSEFVHAGKSNMDFIQDNNHRMYELIVDVLDYYENNCTPTH